MQSNAIIAIHVAVVWQKKLKHIIQMDLVQQISTVLMLPGEAALEYQAAAGRGLLIIMARYLFPPNPRTLLGKKIEDVRMIKNITIVMLCLILIVVLLAKTSDPYQNYEKVISHPRPIGQEIYGAREPNGGQVKIIVYATEWSDETWSLSVLFKDESDNTLRFTTHSPNSPKHWTAYKFKGQDYSEGTVMQLEEISSRSNYIRPSIWEIPEQYDSVNRR